MTVTSASFFFLGATFLLTIANLEHAAHQILRDAADTETFFTALASNYGLEIHPFLALFQTLSAVFSTS